MYKVEITLHTFLSCGTQKVLNLTFVKIGTKETRKWQYMDMQESIEIPGERTVYRIMERLSIAHHPKRKPNSITKEDREAQKSDDKLK